MAFIPGTLVKADETLNRAVQNALSETFYKVGERKEPGYHRSALNSNAIASGGSSEEPSGPWALFIDNGKIKANKGLIWTPDGCQWREIASCDVPDSTKYILVSESAQLLSESETELAEHISFQSKYFETHAMLGLYDATSQKVIQYHFSPIVYMIQTEDFVINP